MRNTGYSTAYIGSANMSHSAMTQGLEWTVKATAQDMPHVLARFVAEFSAYWESDEFEPFTDRDFDRFRKAIGDFRTRTVASTQFFAEISPRPFQLRILEALEATRQSGARRNYHAERNHQGKDNVLLLPTATKAIDHDGSSVGCKESLGGLLKYYHREAA